MKKALGFSILEIIIVLAILVVISALFVPSYYHFQESNNLNAAFNLINNSLSRTQIKSQSIENDSSWGIKIQGNQLTVFGGASYASRDVNLDELINLPPKISFSGLNEIIFSKLLGYPNTTGTISLINGLNQSKIITINEKGVIQ